MIQVYGIKTCDSVKKALTFFKTNAIDIQFTDFRKEPVTPQKIETWATQCELSILFNSKSRTYRDLELSKLNLSDTAKITWMQKEPLLIKRPVIEYHDKLVVGFNQTTYEEIFLS